MRRFFQFILLYIIIPVMGIVLICFVIWNYSIQRANLSLSKDKTTIIAGSSMVECSINDSILTNCKNVGRASTSLELMKDLIEYMIDANNQIDTLFIELSTNSFNTNKQSDERFNFAYYKEFEDIIAFKGMKVFEEYDIYELIPIFLSIAEISTIHYGYYYLDKCNIENGKQWSVQWCDSAFNSSKRYAYKEFIQRNKKNIKAIYELMDFCGSNSVKLVIFIPPSYRLDNWYDSSNLIKFIGSLDERIQIADYSDFKFPDKSYYCDVFHLNNKGATFFCQNIKKNGWCLESTEEFFIRRTQKK